MDRRLTYFFKKSLYMSNWLETKQQFHTMEQTYGTHIKLFFKNGMYHRYKQKKCYKSLSLHGLYLSSKYNNLFTHQKWTLKIMLLGRKNIYIYIKSYVNLYNALYKTMYLQTLKTSSRGMKL